MAEMSLYDYVSDPKLVAQIDKEMEIIDLRGEFDNIKIPTLIIEEDKDLIWRAGKIEKLRRNHINAYFALMKKSRHYPFEDEATRFFRVLKNFIKTVN